jgi:undecaprenyl phosphate-alpha-L-ara4N flippase subunit ArnE
MSLVQVSGVVLLALCVVAEVARELCFKLAALRSSPEMDGYFLRVVRKPLTWSGMVLWALEAVAWVAVLGSVPLSVAFPIATLTYAAVPVAGVLILRERLSRGQIMGAVLVTTGVAWIGWGAL